MAIPAKFDSNMPFVIVTGGSENAFLSKEADGDESHEEEKGTLVQAIGPHLSRVMQLGTAKHVRAAEEVEYDREASVSIVAQAESETVYSLVMFCSFLFGILIQTKPPSQEKTSRSSVPPIPSVPTPEPSSPEGSGKTQRSFQSEEELAAFSQILRICLQQCATHLSTDGRSPSYRFFTQKQTKFLQNVGCVTYNYLTMFK